MGLHNKLVTSLATNVGRVRTNNEDSLTEDRELGLLVLADGMGGYNAGEVASLIATSTVVEIVRRDWPATPIDAAAIKALLSLAVHTAHDRIRARAAADPDCAGMGTTAIACLLNGGRLWAAHIGDSRLYLWRQQRLSQLTQDHSLLEELISRGHYSREDASRLVRKNIVTRALGVEDEISVDLLDEPLSVGDLLLLCSDGLTDMLGDAAIAAILDSPGSELKAVTQALIEAALAAGGRDNVSVALARVEQLDSTDPSPGSWSERLRKWWQAD